MAQEECIRVEGVIEKILPSTTFIVSLANGHKIHAHISGKMRKNFIKLLRGDKVLVEMSSYDLSKGRIVYRQK